MTSLQPQPPGFFPILQAQASWKMKSSGSSWLSSVIMPRTRRPSHSLLHARVHPRTAPESQSTTCAEIMSRSVQHGLTMEQTTPHNETELHGTNNGTWRGSSGRFGNSRHFVFQQNSSRYVQYHPLRRGFNIDNEIRLISIEVVQSAMDPPLSAMDQPLSHVTSCQQPT